MDIDKEELRSLLREALSAHSGFDTGEHQEHHDWLRQRIEREKARAEFWTSLAGKSLPAVIWSAIVAVSGWLWTVVKDHIVWR